MPAHTHLVRANQGADTTNPSGAVPANDSRNSPLNIYASAPDSSVMNPNMIGASGGSQPVSIQNPILGINYIIATEGIYPSRS
jgi:microcystin-dependent protein